jgi:putative glutamine amidotransferase
MKKTLIGLTPQYDAKTNRIWMRHEYTDSLIAAGGLPVLLTQYAGSDEIAAVCDRLDGILFTGGVDIHPRFYGEETEPGCGEIAEIRDIFELALYKEAVCRSMPVFGICRGIQLINVGSGGTLHQHIPGHQDVRHTVRIERGSLIYDIIGSETIMTNSYHHQAVKITAPYLKNAAYSDIPESGPVCEAVWAPDMPFCAAVQWHPENTYNEDMYSRRLFSAFVSACAAFSASK